MEPWISVIVVVAMGLADAGAETGTAYRFRSGNVSGTVWVHGGDARREFDREEGTAASQPITIWKAGGTQRLVLSTQDHTYFDEMAQQARDTWRTPRTLEALGVRDPFVVADVSKIRVDVVPSTGPAVPGSDGTVDCRPVALKLSYDLKLRHMRAAGLSMPARVEGSGEICLAESLPVATLPFGHGLELVSGMPKVDAVIAERLASLRGLPVRWNLTVRRKIEGGEETSATLARTLSDFRATEIPAGSFSVPGDYRYQEPVIVGPIRQKP